MKSRKELRRIPQTTLLSQCAAFERGLLRMTGAWISRLRHAEAKYAAARQLWEWAQQADAMRRRLQELPGGKPDAPPNEKIVSVLEECLFAEDEEPFLDTLYNVLLPAMIAAYSRYLHRTAELPDRPSFLLVTGFVRTLEEQVKTGCGLLVKLYGTAPDTQFRCEWSAHIARMLEKAGGINGEVETLPGGKPEGTEESLAMRRFAGCAYRPPDIQHRSPGSYFSYEHPIEGYSWSRCLKGDPLFERVALAVWLYNEMDAAEYISPILYEVEGMPWEFYYDVARHVWDEARHSEFGYKLLAALGFRPEEFEVWTATYMSSIQMKPHERYAAVTCWYEPGSFTVKPDFLERLAGLVGDEDLAIELLRFDLADETLHVSFGRKWAEKLMRHYGDTRTLESFVEYVKKLGTELRERQGAAFIRTMPPDRRHSIESVRQRVEEWTAANGSANVSGSRITNGQED